MYTIVTLLRSPKIAIQSGLLLDIFIAARHNHGGIFDQKTVVGFRPT